jgi:hypothetical protein
VARAGGEYERFVYEKLWRLFADSTVTLNDKILGKQSGLFREIDISIRIPGDDYQLLYVVQCKDRGSRPADIVILGEFSSVIKDVEAAKGFLICTSGFAKSNYQYARALGIELITIEDVNSDRWKADIQVPFIYIRKLIEYVLTGELVANEELVEKNRGQELTFKFDVDSLMTLDNGQTVTSIKDHLEAWLAGAGEAAQEGVELDLLNPTTRISIADVWVEFTELTANLTVKKKYYLKYLTPSEYSQMRDHVRDTTLPLHISISGPSQPDESFTEIPNGDFPVAPIISVVLEEWTALERAQGKGQPDI